MYSKLLSNWSGFVFMTEHYDLSYGFVIGTLEKGLSF